MKDLDLEELLKVGTQVVIGPEFAKSDSRFYPGQIITLVKGEFEFDNGLYTSIEFAPSWHNGHDFDSIWHLFGNKFEYWNDCKILE